MLLNEKFNYIVAFDFSSNFLEKASQDSITHHKLTKIE
jgi:hypothetical protein